MVSIDLAKQLYLLLSKAKGLIKGNTNISYVYSDINCFFALRFIKMILLRWLAWLI